MSAPSTAVVRLSSIAWICSLRPTGVTRSRSPTDRYRNTKADLSYMPQSWEAALKLPLVWLIYTPRTEVALNGVATLGRTPFKLACSNGDLECAQIMSGLGHMW